MRTRGVARHQRDAEVGHLGGPVLGAEDHVGRLEIAVDHALLVGGADAGRDLAEDAERLFHRHGLAALDVAADDLVEALAVDVLHHQVEVRALHGDGAQVHHVGVIDLRQGAALGEGAGPDVVAVGQLAAHRLDDDVEAGVDVAGQVDDAHAALAEDAEDGVLLVDERPRGEVLGRDERLVPGRAGGRRERSGPERGRGRGRGGDGHQRRGDGRARDRAARLRRTGDARWPGSRGDDPGGISGRRELPSGAGARGELRVPRRPRVTGGAEGVLEGASAAPAEGRGLVGRDRAAPAADQAAGGHDGRAREGAGSALRSSGRRAARRSRWS